MYKTGIITDEISQDLTVAAKLAKQYGLDALEIRSVNEKNVFQMTQDDFQHVKQVADDFDLRICAVSSPLFKCDFGDRTQYEDHLEGLRRGIDAAHLWGTKSIRAFTFWSKLEGDPSLEAVAEMMHRALEIAKAGDVHLLIESEPSVITRNTATLVEFLELMNHPNLGAMWDPGNEIADREAPPPFPDGYHRIRPYIKHVHLKDIKRSDDPSVFIVPALIGDGDVDFHGLLDALKQDGYGGYVSVETHYRVKAELDEGLLMRPQGSAFSQGGYEASILYLDRLRDRYHWMDP